MKTLKPAWRTIVKKNENQNGKLYDILACNHVVPVTAAQATYRQARSCPSCAAQVAIWAAEYASKRPTNGT
jgi:hypothetical protein